MSFPLFHHVHTNFTACLQTMACTKLKQKLRRQVVSSSLQVVAAIMTLKISLETWKPSTNGMNMVSDFRRDEALMTLYVVY